MHLHPPPSATSSEGENLAASSPSGLSAKAGIILGIHNIFIVIPQFLITGLSSLIFALLDPSKSVLHAHLPPSNPSPTDNATDAQARSDFFTRLTWRQDDGIGDEASSTGGSNAVAIIFRIGGLAAAAAFVISWRLARELNKR